MTAAEARRAPLWWAALAGVVAGGALVAVAELLALLFGSASAPFVAVGGAFIDLIPPWVKDLAISLFGTWDKVALFASMGLVHAALTALIGLLGRRRPGLAAALGFLLAAAGFLASPVDSAAALTAQALASVSGLTAVLALLPPLASGPRAAALGRYLGGRTLPIYVIHPLTVALTALDLGPLEASGGGTEGTSALGELLIVPAGTAVAIGLSLLVHALLTRWGPSWAFAAPTLPERGRAGR